MPSNQQRAIRMKFLLSSVEGSPLVVRAQATVLRIEAVDDSEPAVGFAAMTRSYVLDKDHRNR
jgi:hypothetical protein